MVNYPLGRSILWRVSAGYGFSGVYRQTDLNISDPYNEIEFRLSGYPLETALIVESPVTAKSKVSYKLGIILGYYHYKFHEKFKADRLGGRYNFDQTIAKLSGFAQSFLVGAGVKISKSAYISLELTKPVLSFIEYTNDVYATIAITTEKTSAQEPTGQIKSNYSVQNGLNDLGITMGFHIQL